MPKIVVAIITGTAIIILTVKPSNINWLKNDIGCDALTSKNTARAKIKAMAYPLLSSV